MKFRYRNKISLTSLFINCLVITAFFYLILNTNKFSKVSTLKVEAYSTNLSILKEEIPDGSTIDVNNIYIDDNLPGVIYYIVQPGDTLSKIALNFWVTVLHIKKINNLKEDNIKPGQRLMITDQEGFVYISKWETVQQLAKKFDIKPSDILDANTLLSENYKFQKWDEVFIPMSEEQYKKWEKKYKKSNEKWYYTSYRPISIRKKHKNIVAKYRYRPNVYNGFYRWQCTRFVAVKKFPYITAHKQKKLWNGNAKYWYKNAKAAGYPVGHTPRIGAIVVIKYWGRRYYYAGHVWIVKKIDWKNKRLLIEEMNALGKYVVTLRRIPMDSKIIGYIYL